MKPFNLELAKAGHPVCTRDGRKARIICFDRNDDIFPIIALIECDTYPEDIRIFSNAGKCFITEESCFDLFMISKKKSGWINIYSSSDHQNVCFGIYTTEKEALDHVTKDGYIATTKIEWEE